MSTAALVVLLLVIALVAYVYYVVTTNLFFPQKGVVTSIVSSYAESPLLQL